VVAIILIVTFIAVFLGFWAVYLWVMSVRESPKAVLKRRLKAFAAYSEHSIPVDMRNELLKETTAGERMTQAVPFMKKIFMLTERSGRKISPFQFLAVTAFLFMLGCIVGTINHAGLVITLFLAILLGMLPFFYLLYLEKKRSEKFTEQFPDALFMMSRSLRAGHSMAGAVELISQEMSDPIAGFFKESHERQNLGMSMRESFSSLAISVDSLDLRMFITAINIHRDIGGNLTEVLDKIANTIRERLRLKRQVQVYTAQGRMSGYVLAFLPVAVFFIFQIFFPGYEDELLKSETGRTMLIMAFVAQVVGFIVIRKIINIRI
jgi:tight adherence protein B